MKLAAKAHASGQRLLLVADAALIDSLDARLWADDPASFLPHGVHGTGDEAEQPILLADSAVEGNGATLLMLLDRPLPEAPARFTRILTLFEDGTAGHARARAEWKAVGSQDAMTRAYWQQTDRGWRKIA